MFDLYILAPENLRNYNFSWKVGSETSVFLRINKYLGHLPLALNCSLGCNEQIQKEGTNKLITDFKFCAKKVGCGACRLWETLHNSQFKCKSIKKI